jgi:hypothetical protein
MVTAPSYPTITAQMRAERTREVAVQRARTRVAGDSAE